MADPIQGSIRTDGVVSQQASVALSASWYEEQISLL